MRKTVVIIGHDVTNDTVAARYLSRFFHVVVMPRVEGTFVVVREADPCAVVIHADLYTPGEAQRLRDLRRVLGRRVPIIATVERPTSEYLSAAMETDVLACLVRPLVRGQLEDLLNSAVEQADALPGSSWGIIPAYGTHARVEHELGVQP